MEGFLLRTEPTYSISTKNNKQMRRGLPLAAKWIPPAPYRHSEARAGNAGLRTDAVSTMYRQRDP